MEIGLVVAAVGGIVAAVSPYVEWWADHFLQRGLLGAILLPVGFALQSLQYWATLLNVAVRYMQPQVGVLPARRSRKMRL